MRQKLSSSSQSGSIKAEPTHALMFFLEVINRYLKHFLTVNATSNTCWKTQLDWLSDLPTVWYCSKRKDRSYKQALAPCWITLEIHKPTCSLLLLTVRQQWRRLNLPQDPAGLSLQGNLLDQEDHPYQRGQQGQGHPVRLIHDIIPC